MAVIYFLDTVLEMRFLFIQLSFYKWAESSSCLKSDGNNIGSGCSFHLFLFSSLLFSSVPWIFYSLYSRRRHQMTLRISPTCPLLPKLIYYNKNPFPSPLSPSSVFTVLTQDTPPLSSSGHCISTHHPCHNSSCHLKAHTSQTVQRLSYLSSLKQPPGSLHSL